ncbi:interferon alpha-inducible protein 27-like protein 2A [Biomphalaria pfeifferi]|uniref:Interferon alpha-inducible protein 27-like protein 2A n=1 Tax=Biomphalaria pfeifferi TaxID=112525 RepID=A0AAD8AZK2_BIOPF|nr:interferon alpha-inducible protein 27-like protein 2A [Biomphalaria pfeifferi]
MANQQAALFLLFLLLGQPLTSNAYWEEAVGFVVGAATVGLIGPVALAGMGFTSAGITAGSIGATLMSYGVPVGVLQSAGAAGISYSAHVAGGVLGLGTAHSAKHYADGVSKIKNVASTMWNKIWNW